MNTSVTIFGFILSLVFSGVASAEANGTASGTLSGKITLAKGLEKDLTPNGTLFIFAKKASQADVKGVPPLAVLRIPSPKFPVEFSLSQENAMMAGTPFEGPFVVSARYSPSGDALDKSGPEATTDAKKPLKAGAKNIAIELKKK